MEVIAPRTDVVITMEGVGVDGVGVTATLVVITTSAAELVTGGGGGSRSAIMSSSTIMVVSASGSSAGWSRVTRPVATPLWMVKLISLTGRA